MVYIKLKINFLMRKIGVVHVLPKTQKQFLVKLFESELQLSRVPVEVGNFLLKILIKVDLWNRWQ